VQFQASVLACVRGLFSNLIPSLGLLEIFIGLATYLTLAHFEGWFSTDATFHATPKDGSVGKGHKSVLALKKTIESAENVEVGVQTSALADASQGEPSAAIAASSAPPTRKVVHTHVS
jgi:hypothetical protein